MIKLLSFSVWSCNSRIKIKQEITVPSFNNNLISPAIPPLNHTWRSQEYKGYDHQLKKLLIVKQIHLVSTLRRILWTVWRICTLMLGCKELNHCLKRAKEKKNIKYILLHDAPPCLPFWLVAKHLNEKDDEWLMFWNAHSLLHVHHWLWCPV